MLAAIAANGGNGRKTVRVRFREPRPVSRTNGENTLVEVLQIKPVESVNPFQSDNVGCLGLVKTPALTAA